MVTSVIFVLIYFLVLVLVSEIFFSFSFVLVFSHFLVAVLRGSCCSVLVGNCQLLNVAFVSIVIKHYYYY